MKESFNKKSLVFGIIILFVVVSFVPGISGNIGKTINQIDKEPTIFPLDANYTNYINAYWKFDENSGSTAHDSSIHHNDGTIYGATWTTGYSGSSLDFDGVNDYIDLDTHATDLGFNKTDDFIFSFWLKSSMYNLGRIYSASSGIGTNPEIQIFLAPNGTLAIKFVVTSCGFTLYTNNSYNNNIWHYVEIWYNGITNEPTVNIYVDNVLDSSITAWVCPFDYYEFTLTKIGKRSNDSTDYFNGKIDEFKIIKFPGGNQQNYPIVTGPTNGKVGIKYDFTFNVTDPEGDDIWYYVDWGDGTNTGWFGPYPSGQEVTKSHTWYENETYDIQAKDKDIWGTSYRTHHQIVIGNIPPYAPTITGPTSGDPGVTLTYNFKAIDYDGDDIYYYIDWGDGTNTGWFGSYPANTTVTKTHAWGLKGDYNIIAKAKDNLGRESGWSEPYHVRIGNQPPGVPTISGKTSGNTGTEYDYTFAAIDPEEDKVSYYIDWGDGTNTGWLDPHPSGFVLNEGHTWSEWGTYTITIKAKDYPYEAMSGVGTLRVVMPRSMSLINSPLLLLIEKLMERFQHVYFVIHAIMIN